MKRFAFFVFAIVLSVPASFGQFTPPTPPPLPGVPPAQISVVNVPNSFSTISAAVAAGAQDIVVEPGVYRENISINNGRIRAAIPGTVIIDGGNDANTIHSIAGDLVELEGLTIVNSQSPGFYTVAAVFVEFGGSLHMKDCTVFTSNNGVVANYTHETLLRNNQIVGNGNTIGVALYHQNEARDGQGAHLYGNEFLNHNVGIQFGQYNYSGVQIGEAGGTGDTNVYGWVEIERR